MTTASHPRRTVRRLLLGVAGILPVLATLSVVVTGTRPSAQPDPGQTTDAATRLRELADHITDVPADHRVGSYTYTHRQSWTALEGLGNRAQIGRVDVQLWRHVSGAERLTSRRLPSWPGTDHIVDGSDRSQFAGTAAQTDDFTATELPQHTSLTPETIATHPAGLTAQLRQMYPATAADTDRLLSALTELSEYAYLGRAQRATVLRVLADTTGLGYGGETTDIAGRTGITIHHTDPVHATTSWLTINPTTGEFMAYRRVFNRSDGPALSRYALFLEHDRREHL